MPVYMEICASLCDGRKDCTIKYAYGKIDMKAIGSHIRHNAVIFSNCRSSEDGRSLQLTQYGHLSGWERRSVTAHGSGHAIPSHRSSEVVSSWMCKRRSVEHYD
jgi:hypothetical protein